MSNLKIAFPPIVNKNSRILILGTMPGDKSLKLQQYYGHAGNHFWKIIFNLFDQPFSKDYEIRKQLLLDNGIALWDVLKACECEGSSDNNILNEEANDFQSFYNLYPEIKTVFLQVRKQRLFIINMFSNLLISHIIHCLLQVAQTHGRHLSRNWMNGN